MIEQQPRLDTTSTSVFDQHHACPNLVGHLWGVFLHDRNLRARQIIFIQLTDFIEQLRTAFVVEILTWQRPWIRVEASDNVVLECLGGRFEIK